MKILLPVKLLITNASSYDEYLGQRWDTAVRLGAEVKIQNNVATLEMSDHNVGFVTLQDMRAVIAAGGEIEGMPGFLTITATALENKVCEGIPDRFKDLENEEVRKWKEYRNSVNEMWKDSTGLSWISTNPFGHRMKGSEIMRCHDARGINFATVAAFKKAFPNDPPPAA